jgi:hypothetical protein
VVEEGQDLWKMQDYPSDIYLRSYNIHLNVKNTQIMTGVQFPVEMGPSYHHVQASPGIFPSGYQGAFNSGYLRLMSIRIRVFLPSF